MSNRDILELCIGNLLRRKTRTVLAVVGVIVGVCAIVAMVSIGVGLSESFTAQIESYGNLHSIQVYSWGSSGNNSKTYKLNDATVNKMEKIDGVTAITPVINQYLTIGIGHMKAEASVYGVRPEYLQKMNTELEKGRLLNVNDKNALVFGKSIACLFYDPRRQEYADWSNTEPTVDVISKDVIVTGDSYWGTRNEGTSDYHYETYACEGVGLLASTDSEESYRVYMNIDSLKDIINGIKKSEEQTVNTGQTVYNEVLVYVEDIDKVADICTAIKEDYGFQTYSLNDMLKQMQSMATTIEMVLGGIGAVSLLVAAIGIANTMIMSVYERTKEIGIMKVIGASFKDIKKMFLVEAGLIGFGGGILGLALSFGMSALMNTVLYPMMSSLIGTGEGGRVSVIPPWLALGALAFAAMVGILSGYYPAKRAMNLSALEGLKNE